MIQTGSINNLNTVNINLLEEILKGFFICIFNFTQSLQLVHYTFTFNRYCIYVTPVTTLTIGGILV
ncbi:hypothetical protein SAMN05216216_11036 [Lacicoccus qingdaonensis]|uniref:Uncharacterized protein n=1 Tax=Lacicoccus qingdaonensis TaxID=576118 RepID=A0A1G9EWX2_9BACL|nr:hypothetical protein SAMN05216216_11036 [Salinicoccus qingdaonensis]